MPSYGNFHDARLLSQSEIDLFAQWAKAGAPEGDAKDLPPAPTFPEGWQLGEPDVVLKMPEAFTVPASGNDIYRCFVLPIPIDENKTVSAVEFRAGNPQIVHHAIFFLDSRGAARKARRRRWSTWLCQLWRARHYSDRRTWRMGAGNHAA